MVLGLQSVWGCWEVGFASGSSRVEGALGSCLDHAGDGELFESRPAQAPGLRGCWEVPCVHKVSCGGNLCVKAVWPPPSLPSPPSSVAPGTAWVAQRKALCVQRSSKAQENRPPVGLRESHSCVEALVR